MAPEPIPSLLSPLDSYALARALAGLPWQGVSVSPLLGALLSQVNFKQLSEAQTLRRWMGTDILKQVMAEDPHAPPPERERDLKTVPELPASAQVTRSQAQEAARVGRWLDAYVAWAGSAANETPLIFHQGTGLYLAAVAVGRRLSLETPWQQQIFPNLYVMTVAVSTYYRKSAGLNLGAMVARAAMPHMLMPQPGSPENFMNMLGGVLPSNFEDIPAPDRERLLKGNLFAAQRGILRDELSALFKAMGRDYMAGMKELLMQLYDCPPYLDSNTNHRGIVVIRDTALSILGAATPVELASALSTNDWYNGNLARFALLTPEPTYQERPSPKMSVVPLDLVARLARLHDSLPSPAASGEGTPTPSWSLVAEVWEPCHRYEQALRRLTAPDSVLDDRLRAVYGRLHVQALKIAVLLAALDWSDAGGEGQPVMHKAHWYRAQQITETWRSSAHRLLRDLGENDEQRLEHRIIRLLRTHADGLSARALYRGLSVPRRAVVEVLNNLCADGTVRHVAETANRTGPRPGSYRLNL